MARSKNEIGPKTEPREDHKLFTDHNGNPMIFKVSASDPHADDYKFKITHNGGQVVDDDTKLGTREKNTLIKLSTTPIDVVTYSPDFVDASIKHNAVLSLDAYAHPTSKKRKALDTGEDTEASVAEAAAAAAVREQQQRHQQQQQQQRGPHDLTDVIVSRARAAANAASAGISAAMPSAGDDDDDDDENSINKGYFSHGDSPSDGEFKKNHPRKKTSKFNDEKDEFILEQVRLKPRYRTSHKFYDDLANSPVLKGHTGHSVRSRCRVHLLPKIEYVYKTNEMGELILDDKGNKIPVPLVDVPNTLKNRFSAEEDHLLCTEVIKHVLGNNDQSKFTERDERGFFDEKLLSVGISFFNDFAAKYPNHSSPSWRDRFRKFARTYGVQKYIHDYNESIKNNREPEAMKNLTRRKNRKRDTADKYVTEADDAAAEADSMDVDGPGLTSTPVSSGRRGRRGPDAAASDNGENDEAISHAQQAQDAAEALETAKAAAAAAAAAGVATATVIGAEIPKDEHAGGALDEEIGEVKSSNIDEALREVDSKAQAEKLRREQERLEREHLHQESEDEEEEADADADADAENEGDEGSREIKPSQIGSQAALSYLEPGYNLDELVTDVFFKVKAQKGSDSIIVNTVKDINGLDDEDILHDSFAKIGIKPKLVSHILLVGSGDSVRVYKFLRHLFNNLKDVDRTNPTEEELSRILFVDGKKGFWNPKYDTMLKKKQVKELRKLHGSKRVNARIDFLKSNDLW